MIIIDPYLDKKYIYEDVDFDEPVRIRIDRDSYDKITGLRIISPRLVFERCFFNNEVSITTNGNIDVEFRISFKGCLVNSLIGSFISTNNIIIHCFSSHFERFDIHNKFVKFLYINNCFGSFYIEGCNNLKISYTKENIYYQVWKRLFRSNNEIIKTETKFDVKDVKKMTFYTNEKPISLGDFEDIIDFDKIKFGEKHRAKCSIPQSDIEKLNISLSLDYTNGFGHKNTSVKEGRLRNLTLRGHPEGQVTIENLIIENIFLYKFSPVGNFNLMEIESNKEYNYFEIKNSVLDNTWFYGINFNNFKKIAFYKSSFVNTKITSCIFPSVKTIEKQIKSTKSVYYPNKIDPVFYREQYELFLELKLAFDKGGNIYESQKMKAVALKSLENVKNLSFWDEKLILLMNKFSNNNGVSPLRAFGWFLFLVIVFQAFNLLSFKSIYFDLNGNNTWDLFYENFRYLIVIANPAHKLSSLAPANELTTGTYVVSFFSRIFIGYIYYQFIVAFRRFGKF